MGRGSGFETMVDRHNEAPTFEELEELAAQEQTDFEDRADEARKERDWI